MRRNLFVSVGSVAMVVLLVVISCKKINLATDLGGDLIPEVDNIHTFDTTIEIETYNNIFDALNDTLRVSSSFEQFLGKISNDPLFGQTDARMYFQVGPTSRTNYYFPNTADKLFLDSVVLIVNYLETYGDSSIAQTINVSEVTQGTHFSSDTAYNIRDNNFNTFGLLGSATVIPHTLNDSVYFGTDTVKSAQNLRIKLDNSFGQRLMGYDSTNAYKTDSAFKTYFKGFALQSVNNGNAVMGFDLSKSGLALYYRYERKDSAGKFDTTVTTFPFVAGADALANYVERDYSGTQITAGAGDDVADQLVYVQNNPGTYSLLKIPALANMNNRIVHLAELQMESVYDVSDTIFREPRLYIDALSNGKNINVPYAVSDYYDNYTGTVSSTGLLFFGYYGLTKKDPSGNNIKYWRFNLTRYVQSVVNKKNPSYDLRLYARPGITITDSVESGGVKTAIPMGLFFSQSNVSTNLAAPVIGRVRLGGGQHPTQKMKMRIVYSKI